MLKKTCLTKFLHAEIHVSGEIGRICDSFNGTIGVWVGLHANTRGLVVANRLMLANANLTSYMLNDQWKLTLIYPRLYTLNVI